MNNVNLIGRLVRDPEINYTASGLKFSMITLAVSSKTQKEHTDFVPIKLWGQEAQALGTYSKKGDLIAIEGSFVSATYNDQNGKQKTQYYVQCNRLQFLAKKQTNTTSNTTSNTTLKNQDIKQVNETQKSTNDDDDFDWNFEI